MIVVKLLSMQTEAVCPVAFPWGGTTVGQGLPQEEEVRQEGIHIITFVRSEVCVVPSGVAGRT